MSRTKRFGTWMAICGIWWMATPVLAGPTYSKLVDKGWSYLEKEKYSRAAEAFERALEWKESPAEEALIGLAHARFGLERYAAAATLAREILSTTEDPGIREQAKNLLGVSLLLGEAENREALEEAETLLGEVTLKVRQGGRSALIPQHSWAKALIALDRKQEAMEVLRNLIHTAAPFDHPTMDQARIDYCDLRREQSPVSPKRVAELADPFLPEPRKGERLPPPGEEIADIEKPVKIRFSDPQMPDAAREARVQKVVSILGTIDTEGCVTPIEVVDGAGFGLEESAIEAFSSWVFRPARNGDVPQEVQYTASINFRLQ